MKRGILNKSGKYWNIQSAEMKNPLPIMGNFGLTDDMLGKEVEFDNSKGPVALIRFHNKNYTKAIINEPMNTDNNRTQGDLGQNRTATHGDAHAPYNFVPINDRVIPYTIEQNKELFSGYIELILTTKTPLFIRGKGTDFFGVNFPTIPGSSIRGLIHTLVEIISYSEFSNGNKNKCLFYRNISDRFYLDKFIKRVNGYPPIVKSLVKSGWLSKSGRDYYLSPSNTDAAGRQYYKVNGQYSGNFFQAHKWDNSSSSWITCGLSCAKFSFKEFYFDPGTVQKIKHKGTFDLEYNIIKNLSSTSSHSCAVKAFLVVSGSFGKKKHFQWAINESVAGVAPTRITKLVEKYLQDDNREDEASLLEIMKRNHNKPVPCFYLENGGNIEAIGHTGIFRLPYKHNVKDFSAQKTDSELPDFTTSIFGSITKAGKVFFEDGIPLSGKPLEIYEEKRLEILQSPKPTCFQHYVEQPEGAHGNSLHHWDTDGAKIRGHKLYWHRETSDNPKEDRSWVFDDSDVNDFNKKNKILADPVKPVKAEQEFVARVRFSELSDIQLGALFMALILPEGCYHKLGMGKPLGLGSVHFQSRELVVYDLVKRYSSLFSESDWKPEKQSKDMSEFKNAFVRYVNHFLKTSYNTIEEYWNKDPRMKELKMMLTFKQDKYNDKEWLSKTSYMEIEKQVLDIYGRQILENGKPKKKNEYSDRQVLPKPSFYK